jgi:hypothetical protein
LLGAEFLKVPFIDPAYAVKMRWRAILSALFVPSLAMAQPADCPPLPTTGSIPLWLNIGGQPNASSNASAQPNVPSQASRQLNVPSNVSGQIELEIPVPASGALACNDARPLPTDVLAGPPARDLLAGPGSAMRPVRPPEDDQDRP